MLTDAVRCIDLVDAAFTRENMVRRIICAERGETRAHFTHDFVQVHWSVGKQSCFKHANEMMLETWYLTNLSRWSDHEFTQLVAAWLRRSLLWQPPLACLPQPLPPLLRRFAQLTMDLFEQSLQVLLSTEQIARLLVGI